MPPEIRSQCGSFDAGAQSSNRCSCRRAHSPRLLNSCVSPFGSRIVQCFAAMWSGIPFALPAFRRISSSRPDSFHSFILAVSRTEFSAHSFGISRILIILAICSALAPVSPLNFPAFHAFLRSDLISATRSGVSLRPRIAAARFSTSSGDWWRIVCSLLGSAHARFIPATFFATHSGDWVLPLK